MEQIHPDHSGGNLIHRQIVPGQQQPGRVAVGGQRAPGDRRQRQRIAADAAGQVGHQPPGEPRRPVPRHDLARRLLHARSP